MRDDKFGYVIMWIGLGILALVIILLAFFGLPHYHVWQQEMSGKAKLAEAEQSKLIQIADRKAALEAAEYDRKIQVVDAQSRLEVSKLQAAIEVERAKGVAEANKIIGDSLKDNEAYLRYLWIDQLGNQQAGRVIYIPTEAGLPILEAGRTVIDEVK